MVFSRMLLLALGLCAATSLVQGQIFSDSPGSSIGPRAGTVTTATQVIDADVEICDIDLAVDISHTWSGDLSIVLTLTNDMGATMSTIITGDCGNQDNIVEVFSDGGSIPASSCDDGGAPVQPDEPLANFNTYSTQGTWTLTVTDNLPGDSGTLNNWALIVTPCEGTGTGMGDPHFQSWNGQWYDFHGECDIVFISAPEFAGAGLDIHIRTTSRYEYSFIESAAIKIGDDVLQVSSFGEYLLNGIASAKMPAKLDKYTVTHTSLNEKQHVFDVDIANGQHIIVSTYKDMVAVKMLGAQYKHFSNSVGLLGSFGRGELLARNGTLLSDPNDFGNEWQVKEDEPKMFEINRFPQHPTQCKMPTHTKTSRRLGESIARHAAEKACAHWEADLFQLCIFDVMATGDMDVAHAMAV